MDDDDSDENTSDYPENTGIYHLPDDFQQLLEIFKRSEVTNSIILFDGRNQVKIYLHLDFCVRLTHCVKCQQPLQRNEHMIIIQDGVMYKLPRPLEHIFMEILQQKRFYKLQTDRSDLISKPIFLSRSVTPKDPEISVSVKSSVELNYLATQNLLLVPCIPFGSHDLLPYPTQVTDTDGAEVSDAHRRITTGNNQLQPGTSDQEFNLPSSSNLFFNHRHMNYCDIRTRHESFRNWPHPPVQDPVRLVEYGFFYTGRGDLVRCYSCGVGLKDWGRADDPLLEHMKHSENCRHIEFHLDSTLVELYKSRLRDGTFVSGDSTGRINVDRHPEYQQDVTRISSFSKWPRNLRPAQEVAAAGFFYTGFQDLVRCFHCDGGLRSWDQFDDPWVEHARWFPDCDFVKRVKGEQFIQNIQAAVHGLDTEEEITSSQMGNMRLYGPIDPKNLKKESDHPIYTQDAQTVINTFGYSRNAVRMAIDECIAEQKQWNTEVLVNILVDKQEQGIPLPVDSPRSESPLQSLTVDDSSEESVLKTYETIIRNVKCIQCEDEDANVLFLPCGHHRMCTGCARDVIMCPVCGKTVKEQIKTYRA